MLQLSLGTAVAAAVMSGIFFAFSSFIVTALGNLHPAEGIKAMQRINVDVFCWSFSLLFFGIPLAALILGVYAVLNWTQPHAIYFLIGSVTYLLGCFLVTAVGNVPLNDSLARLDAGEQSADAQWRKYLAAWIRWNHVRAAACMIACIVFAGASLTLKIT